MSYLTIIGTIVLALCSLHKDWTNYKHRWARRTVFCFIMLVGAAQFIKTKYDRDENDKTQKAATRNIDSLKGQVASLQGQAKAANEAQAQNTILFMQQFTRLSDKVRDLQTDITTADLRKQLVSVQSDLQKTQRAMAPAPKAKLTFSFVPFFNLPSSSNERVRAATETTLSADQDDTVHIQYTVINATEVAALEGEMTLYICGICKFAKEPENFRKLKDSTEINRYATFDRILPHVNLDSASLDVVVPRTVKEFSVGISYRCRTCALENALSSGVVHVARSFVRPLISLPNKTKQPNKKK